MSEVPLYITLAGLDYGLGFQVKVQEKGLRVEVLGLGFKGSGFRFCGVRALSPSVRC